MEKHTLSRRSFLASSIKTGIVLGLPTIVPSSVFGKNAPSNRINIGAIGNGRISTSHDMPGVWKHDMARIIAVCDLDSLRVEKAKNLVNDVYTKKATKRYKGVKTYTDYRELLQNKDIDAVLISTPDHWHAKIGVDAARAGKHIYMQKPASLTIAEGRTLSDVVQKTGVIFQIGSQQRSWEQFRIAAELVLNGRIGQLKTVMSGFLATLRAMQRSKCRFQRHLITICGSVRPPQYITPKNAFIRKRITTVQAGYVASNLARV